MYDTPRLLLKHPDFSDWKGMYHNLWQHPESAKYMLWSMTGSEEEAQERMRRSLKYQESHAAWFIYEKESGEPIGFAGFCPIGPGIVEDTGIALGPAFVGKGYGTEILHRLLEIARNDHSAHRFVASCRTENIPSQKMILSCGFRFTHRESRVDPRDNTPYHLDFYEKEL